MTRSEFTLIDGVPTGFCIAGHTGFGHVGEDIVCAAVSSAAYMAANTITEVCGCSAAVTVEDGRLCVQVSPEEAAACRCILEGLRLHMQALREQYPAHIEVTITEGTSHAEH